jgi:hypothetical protein
VKIFTSIKKVMNRACVTTCAVLALLVYDGTAFAQQTARPASPAEVRIPLSDARKIGANSVRFSAAQFTDDAPTVVLFGASTPVWHKVRSALRQAVFEGNPIAGIFMGPVNEAPSLEIYAKGHHVTRPIDPRAITESDLTALVRDVTREYYR